MLRAVADTHAVIWYIFADSRLSATKNFKGGTNPRIYPWNQSKIENRKSSSPRIYPWGQSKI